MLSLLAQLTQQQIISKADYYFAKMIADKQQPYAYAQPLQNLAILLAALCSYSYQQGNTCLSLQNNPNMDFFGLAYRQGEQDYLAEIWQKIDHLPVTQWQEALAEHIAFSQDPQQHIAPLVFQFGRLYFYRVWQDESKLANYLQSAVKNSQNFHPDPQAINAILHQLFEPTEQEINWQQIAVATAVKQSFCLITGGPGTGKTTTVFRLLAMLQLLRQQQHLPLLRIKLVAPTGKAASRLSESLQQTLDREVKKIPQLAELIQTQASTIHRLLRIRPLDDHCYFNANNPLPLDVLVVDEASMVDLAMMEKLLSALPAQAKLILLGDKDQLSSVEAGAILGELGQFLTQVEQQGYSPALTQYLLQTTGQQLTENLQATPIGDHLCSLRKSYRFQQYSGIGHLANAVNQCQDNLSLSLFSQYQDIDFILLQDNVAQNIALIVEHAVQYYQQYLQQLQGINVEEVSSQQLQHIFALFKKCRFLTALRAGDYGVDNLNQQIALRLNQEKLVNFRYTRDWYLGKPIMVLENDNQVELYNGDIGLALLDEHGQGKVWFEVGNNQFKGVITSRIPRHEPAFMMTVHKSQGSEFEHTLLVLPNKFTPLLSKELIYTAVTRAKQQFSVFSNENIWKTAVRNPVKRQSGLAQWLGKLG
ncbi:DNA helicase/exodeoxyribonuclease V alpha subunit [Volucribacter psittacicida]|uniref:RecBCD enzyme subunit RecD n=1 Tax=Volucribacter psittacicida TaxID=203482 RepID=A0A4R1G5N3_9PAST|nr:exodeoxyribonuclease V subunit alpha [Volucribacter psittacicida]TCK01883.1 DNA helicase/exodeoxyribonuclease V alpha subunit [Volucribacter psittacicida]